MDGPLGSTVQWRKGLENLVKILRISAKFSICLQKSAVFLRSNSSKLVQTRPDSSRLVQTRSNLSKTRSNSSKLVQTRPDLSKLVQNSSKLVQTRSKSSKLVQIRPNFSAAQKQLFYYIKRPILRPFYVVKQHKLKGHKSSGFTT